MLKCGTRVLFNYENFCGRGRVVGRFVPCASIEKVEALYAIEPEECLGEMADGYVNLIIPEPALKEIAMAPGDMLVVCEAILDDIKDNNYGAALTKTEDLEKHLRLAAFAKKD